MVVPQDPKDGRDLMQPITVLQSVLDTLQLMREREVEPAIGRFCRR